MNLQLGLYHKEKLCLLFVTGKLCFILSTDKPTPPQGPVDIMESAVTSVEFKWKPPKDSGGCPITSYTIERQQCGRNKWSNLGEIPGNSPSYKDPDVDPGRRYCYRISAKNTEGKSDYLQTEDIPAGVLRESLLSTQQNMNNNIKEKTIIFWGSLASQRMLQWKYEPPSDLEDKLALQLH